MSKDLPRIAITQMNSNHIVTENLQQLESLIGEQKSDFDMLFLPENFAHMPRNERERTACAEKFGQGEIQSFLKKIAQQHHCWVIAGSVPILVDKVNGDRKIFQACLVYDHQGELRKRYDKVHLFDVTLPNGDAYHESSFIEFGDPRQDPTVTTPWGLLGLSICYDVRFPEFYRAMPDQVFILSVPAAFTYDSGRAHWQTLLKARAIENQVYVAAAAQTGEHSNGRKTWGHSMLIDPWGKTITEISSEQKVVSTPIDLAYIQQVRDQFPCLHHKRT